MKRRNFLSAVLVAVGIGVAAPVVTRPALLSLDRVRFDEPWVEISHGIWKAEAEDGSVWYACQQRPSEI